MAIIEEEKKIEKEKQLKEIEEQRLKAKFDMKINTERFDNKIRSLDNKTKLFRSKDELEEEKKLNTFYNNEQMKTFNISEFENKINTLNSTTFDHSMKFNFRFNEKDSLFKTEKMMNDEIKREREELEGFKVFINYFLFF